jgi:basic amino acid/polyamine antiporter, APA family
VTARPVLVEIGRDPQICTVARPDGQCGRRIEMTRTDNPQRTLGVFDAVAIVLGIVIGSGIFFMPSLVATNSPSSLVMLGLWLAGGLIGLAGALCYAELATTYPNTGGDYYFLRRAYGPEVGFLFVWGRMTVIQTGAMAAAAFIGGHYASELLPLGAHSAAIYAALIVVLLTVLNLFGLRFGKWTQNLLTSTITVGLVAVTISGLALGVTGGAGPEAAVPPTSALADAAGPDMAGLFGMIGLAMIFVLYTYGGWNEAAYLSAEIRLPQRNIALALVLGVAAVTGIYLLVNIAFLAGMGRTRMAESGAVAADLLRQAAGEPGAVFISLLVVIAVLSTVNASIITGGRSNYALGRDYPKVFGAMGGWNASSSVPAPALLVQASIGLLLIVLAPLIFQDGGVEAMVAYTAPVFWFFFFLAGMAVLVLRWWDSERPRPFEVPLYPLTPFLFCGVCLYMLYSAIAYAGAGSLVGLAVLLGGAPFIALRHRHAPA